MEDLNIVSYLTGPTGGVFALGMLSGVLLTWGVNLKIMKPFVERAHAAEMKAMQAQIDALKSQVSELVHFKEQYMNLLEKNFQKTVGT